MSLPPVQRVRRHLRRVAWQVRNFDRIVQAQSRPGADPQRAAMVQELRCEGILVRQSAECFFAEGAQRFSAAEQEAKRLWAEVKATPRALGGSGAYARKDYKVSFLPLELRIEDPFVQLALDEPLLALVQDYLGMRPLLRAVELWWDFPTTGPAKETQLWHRDGDDVMNVKMFIYWNNVDRETGPFCFLPTTHPGGERWNLAPEHDTQGRTTDEQMARVVPSSEWQICTGSAGTVVICDTCGYHKGLKPTHKERLMLMIQYTSGTPRYPRTLKLTGDMAGDLTAIQRDALGMIRSP